MWIQTAIMSYSNKDSQSVIQSVNEIEIQIEVEF